MKAKTMAPCASDKISYAGGLQLITDIYEELSIERRIRSGSLNAEDLVKATIDLFLLGIFDKAGIREGLRVFLERNSHLQ
ncbi:hypothetical protein [Mesorhizobium retamae]|uniref:Uncharacterized protein n=1 Tax=Mesorhizobium retamae TaxID=2912854 RepID=A0ABS9QPZ4_9HYPH|nr:hypothetical protein [Mesorhizobium sp. IRAMC:0171]MCG7508619.1 hypothetical protein [Mesorhizobium sp. IRAMC:0171]